MIISLFLRLMALLTLLMFATVAVARSQPYDDGGLRETLFSKDCQPPCFIGIHPNITKRDQAVELLKASHWAANITSLDNRHEIIWDWNGKQPVFLRNSHTE